MDLRYGGTSYSTIIICEILSNNSYKISTDTKLDLFPTAGTSATYGYPTPNHY